MATSNKTSNSNVQSEEEIQEDEGENLDEQKTTEETQEEPTNNDKNQEGEDDDEFVPLEEVQQPTMSVAEKLQAIGKKPAPFSKAAAKYESDSIINSINDLNLI